MIRRPRRFVSRQRVEQLLHDRPLDPGLLAELRDADSDTDAGGSDRAERFFGP